MRLYLIRHGDPDYDRDVLLESGKAEAAALSAVTPSWNLDAIYASPHGRAQETAAIATEALHMPIVTLDWLREFPAELDLNGAGPDLLSAYNNTKLREDGSFCPRIMWDILPAYLYRHPEFFHPTAWRDTDLVRRSDMLEKYAGVERGVDRLLLNYGYERRNPGPGEPCGEPVYTALAANRKHVALFCHFGVTCVILSHLLNISPFALWHTMCAQTSTVTELVTEEREKGVAKWRVLRFGDTGHLVQAGLQPAYIARFAEIYDCDERH